MSQAAGHFVILTDDLAFALTGCRAWDRVRRQHCWPQCAPPRANTWPIEPCTSLYEVCTKSARRLHAVYKVTARSKRDGTTAKRVIDDDQRQSTSS